MISGLPILPQLLPTEPAATPQPTAPDDFNSLLQQGPAAIEGDEAMVSALPADALAASSGFTALLQGEAAPLEAALLEASEAMVPDFSDPASTVSGDMIELLERGPADLEVAGAPVMDPVLSIEPLPVLSEVSSLQQRETVQSESDEASIPETTPVELLSIPGLHPLDISTVAAASLPVAEGLSALTRVLPTPTPDGDEAADAPESTGDSAAPASEPMILEIAELTQPPVVSTESVEMPLVEVIAETSRAASETRAALPPPEPLDVVRAAPPDDTHLRFQRLTHDQLTLRIEDADGAMDVEVSREQAALQVRIVAPVEAIPELMGLESAIEGALLALGLELGSYTTASRDDESLETEHADDDGEGEVSETETEGRSAGPNRLLDMVV
ncbi:MAG: hypothetical protein P8R54_18950 [Myxococcota bacterium]|nr:hypothetical protein [Myxococcota bacterium]